MRFEVYGIDRKRKFVTESERCVPDDKALREMKAAGYTFLRDGKKWVPRKEKA